MSNKEFNIQDPQLSNQEATDDEIKLKDIIKELRSWKQLFVDNSIKILLIGIIGGAIGFIYAYFSKPVYTAKLTFVMRADAGMSAASGLAGLSSLLGGGTSAASTNPLDRIVELLGSDRIVGEALLTPAEISGKNDLLINHYINIKQLRKAWGKDTLLLKVNFKDGDEFQQLSLAQRKATKIITNIIAGQKGTLKKVFDKKSGIISVTVSENHEELAIGVSKKVYDKLVEFYINESVASLQSRLNILQAKVDSIKYALNATQRAAAVSSDQGLGLILQQDRVDQKRLGLKENVLTLMYSEAQKNLEQLNFILATTSPSFNIIDQPYSPIYPARKSKIIFSLIGIFFAGIFSVGFILVRIFYKKMLN
jgi:uncharacterized protein involved in exopolysaccharide biosynthesis